MKISVVVCTYNRADMLPDTLASFMKCDHSGVDFEVLIVDNKSTDQTREIAESFCAKYPSIFRYHFEPIQGLSAARNTALKIATGEIIAYVDDDVFFDNSWLISLHRYFLGGKEIDCVGGKVLPHFEIARPSWLEEPMLWIYGVTRYGSDPKRIVPPDIPIGCNMAFRRAVFQRVGGFASELGRIGSSLLSNEESELFARMNKAGMKVFYAPEMAVQHRVPAPRLQIEWVKRRYYWQGVSDLALIQISENPLNRVELVKKAWTAFRSGIRPMLRGPLAPRPLYWNICNFPNQLHFYYHWGMIRGALIAFLQSPRRTSPIRGVSGS